MKFVSIATVFLFVVALGWEASGQHWPYRQRKLPYRTDIPYRTSLPYHIPQGKGLAVDPRSAGGWYRRGGQWHHDGGLNPDTNYSEQNKVREYIQLEDPEGVYARTHSKRK